MASLYVLFESKLYVWWILLLLSRISNTQGLDETPDIVAIVPNRDSLYRNEYHNALRRTAKRQNVSIEIRDIGDFNIELYKAELQKAVATPTAYQPKVYCIWPATDKFRYLLKELHDIHNATIIQSVLIPYEEEEWEYLAGYTGGQDDSLLVANAASQMQDALKERNIENGKIAVVGFPESYPKYQRVLDAFRKVLDGSDIEITHAVGPDWGTQPAYIETLKILNKIESTGESLHGFFGMDDRILTGVYQALEDSGNRANEFILVGSVCNGARELLQNDIQYGTSVSSPTMSGMAAILSAVQWIKTGNVIEKYFYPPTVAITGQEWSTAFIEFEGEEYTVDELCTWDAHYERSAGILSVDMIENTCQYIDCLFIPDNLFWVGHVMVAINYGLAVIGGVLLYVYTEKKTIKMAQPFFLGIVLAGSMVDTTSIIFMSRDNQHFTEKQLDAACFAWPWLLSIGHMVTTATLVAKIYRVKLTCMSDGTKFSLRKTKVSVSEVSGAIICFVLFDVAILTAWYLTDPLRWTLKVSGVDSSGFVDEAYGTCSFEKPYGFMFPVALLVFHFGLLMYANILAYQTSHFHKISDSKNVSTALFNSIQLMLVTIPTALVAQDNVRVTYILRITFVFFNNFAVLVLVVWSKLFFCIVGKGDVLPDFRSIIAADSSLRYYSGAYSITSSMHHASPSVVPIESVCSVAESKKIGSGVISSTCPYCKNLPPIKSIDMTGHAAQQPKSRLSDSLDDSDSDLDSW